MKFYRDTCLACSRLITRRYSTSFSMGIRAFAPRFRGPIYSVYGFVRFADEIVDTFHDFPKARLLERFRNDTFLGIAERISLNPVLDSFQETVHRYGIENELITAFLDSMEMDLHFQNYEQEGYENYIYGSAEVVGLMCLRVFCEGDRAQFERLKPGACALGSAFQKVNFLRDMGSDFEERGRVYFPKVDFNRFSEADKTAIEADIQADFDRALEGIRHLPKGARLGVYVAYVYYRSLLEKIRLSSASELRSRRIRVSNRRKVLLLCTSTLRHQLNLI